MTKELLAYMNNMQKTFEEHLMEVHAEQYHGPDDNMPDDYERWLEDLDKQMLITEAQIWGVRECLKIAKGK